MLDINQAVSRIQAGETLKLSDGNFVQSTYAERFKRFVFKGQNEHELHKISEFLTTKITGGDSPEKKEYLKLANALIKQYPSSKEMRLFDRTLGVHRDGEGYANQVNQKNFSKWTHYGMAAEPYHKHADFATFMEKSGLLSQMKITRDTILQIDGEPAINVNGKPMKWTDLKKQFESVYSKQYKETFIVEKDTQKVFTYLDNGRGLQPHQPFLTESNPISVLNEQDYQRVLAKAHEFIRPGEEGLTPEERQKRNADRPFVFQIVTSFVKGPDTNFHNLIVNSKHPYIRVIVGKDNPVMNTKKGEVYEVGYGWQSKVNSLASTKGQFRSPDVWNYKSAEQRVVTNIPISQEEANALNQYTMKYHRSGVNLGNPVGFHILRQNCSSFARYGALAAGIKVPTEINASELIKEISPNWLSAVGNFFIRVNDGIKTGIGRAVSFLPQSFRDTCRKVDQRIIGFIRSFFEGCAALGVSFVQTVLGNGKGEGGKKFVPPNAPVKNIEKEEKSWKEWFSLSSYRFNLPGILQRWQREQASTVIYDNPVKLSIVP